MTAPGRNSCEPPPPGPHERFPLEPASTHRPKRSPTESAGPLQQQLIGKALLWAVLALLPVLGITVQVAAGTAAPPTSLYGKSVVISWSETRQRRDVGQSHIDLLERNESLSIYVGTAGRVFSRLSSAARIVGGRGWTNLSEEVAGDTGTQRVPSFSGRSMTLFLPSFGGTGVRRVLVDFDAGFGVCNAKVGYAWQAGHTTPTIQGRDSKTFLELLAVNVRAAVCSVQNGNVFGAQ
jgi:hypothetical protein